MADKVEDGKGTNVDPNVKPNEGVSFSPEQQKYLDEVLIPKVMGRAGAEHKKAAEELSHKNQEMTTRLEELDAKFKAMETSQQSATSAKDDKEKLLNENEELKRVNRSLQAEREEIKKQVDTHKKNVEDANSRMLELRKRTAIQQAASKCNFRDLKVIEVITADNVRWDGDSNSFVVVNDKGAIRMNSMMDPLSLDEYYREVASSMPYLVNGDVVPGAGSTEAKGTAKSKFKLEEVFGPKSDARKAIALKKESPELYRSMKQQAIEQGLLGVNR